MRTYPSDREKILAKRSEPTANGCIEYTGYISNKGYGRFYKKGKYVFAHRVTYEEFVGPIPDGMCVIHKCDNTRCINPDHLTLGTSAENTRDKVDKGRHPVGNDHCRVLTEAQAAEIKRLYAAGGYSHSKLAVMFGCSKSGIFKVINGKMWAHVREPM